LTQFFELQAFPICAKFWYNLHAGAYYRCWKFKQNRCSQWEEL